jgi:hypothetical protein
MPVLKLSQNLYRVITYRNVNSIDGAGLPKDEYGCCALPACSPVQPGTGQYTT